MRHIDLKESPLIPDASPVKIYCREYGSGSRTLVYLHGGWGYEVYPFDKQTEAFGADFKILIPDRSGYGRSMRIDRVPTDFHARAAVETATLLRALEIERPVLWGHSDGAVIAALMGLASPESYSGIILEAFHFLRGKPSSREFFETMAADPDVLGEKISRVLSRDHGEDYWRRLILMNGYAWLDIAAEAEIRGDDLYDGRLGVLEVPCVFIHGGRDPRTEPGELEKVQRALPSTRIAIVEGGGHSPHSESGSYVEVNRIAGEFLFERS
jgi:pimeloyl-ACP methyl ester carboxylesterase